MLTLTSEYALRALICLAQHREEAPLPGKEIAQRAGIPAKYLSKILGDLVRTGVLGSSRGKTGGFTLARPAQSISLLEALIPFEPLLLRERSCPFGNTQCGDDDPCLGHDGWKKVLVTFETFLRGTSVYDVAIHKSERQRKSKKKVRHANR